MKTDTVNTEKWEVNEAAYNSYDIINHGLNNTRINIKTTEHSNAATLKIKENAELIVQAVNACKDINPDNPLNVAKVLPQLFEALKGLVENCAIDARGEPNYYAMALKAIKNATK